jgi:hypothetical protein
MKIKEIAFGIWPGSDYAKEPFVKDFNYANQALTEMFWYSLNILKATSETNSHFKFIPSKNEGFNNEVKGFCNFLIPFDFSYYFSLNVFDKKKMLLDIIYQKLNEVADGQKIDKQKLQTGYQYCLDHNLEFKWRLNDRFYISPDKKYYGVIECYWEMDFVEAVAIVFNSSKQELFREKLFKESPTLGNFENIHSSNIVWEKNVFSFELVNVFYDKTKQNRWEIEV